MGFEVNANEMIDKFTTEVKQLAWFEKQLENKEKFTNNSNRFA